LSYTERFAVTMRRAAIATSLPLVSSVKYKHCYAGESLTIVPNI